MIDGRRRVGLIEGAESSCGADRTATECRSRVFCEEKEGESVSSFSEVCF